MTFAELKQEVLDTYMNYFVEGFKLNNISLIDKMVKYPIAYINDVSVTMCDTYPINPQTLKEEKQWDHSINWKFEVAAVNEKDAHAVASAV